jgi:hypothetical protein
MVGSGDLVDLFVGKIFVSPVDEASQFASVDKERALEYWRNIDREIGDRIAKGVKGR